MRFGRSRLQGRRYRNRPAFVCGNIVDAGNGGGVGVEGDGSSLTCSKASIKGNDTRQYGGAIYNDGGQVELTNCIVSGNTADYFSYSRGGGIYTIDTAATGSPTVKIYSSTIAGNYATYAGGGLYHTGGTTTATNSIFWDNAADTSNPEIYGTISATYCDVEGSYSGTGNIDLDPYFVDPYTATSGNPTILGDFHLCYASGVPAGCSNKSNAIDVGDDGTNIDPDPPGDDIDNQVRPYDAGYDMGADEYGAP